ncbi:GCFC-domain-containing protein [Coniophora puteana RWD-64-598 SS2]|uniref:GCFC-domain-containing protein n=1 Tax=Coniophora puteana (strain RWD-64-598) TaxID=741705 RepID=A0A5M3MP70_CONPW|nr:GCFC-domain-containing protein [Coniophora puteana RWD-64-598 SS2]EIW80893.1 GCFC-domain-containing protein [Coniophora puteana RWD-64-598 SS2]
MADGDSPVVFKRSKARPGQRTREKSPDAAAAANASLNEAEDSPITLASKLRNKTKRAKPKAKLSFGGDNEGEDKEVFQVKKSSLGQKLTLGKNASNALPMSLDQATITSRSNGPVYDATYLAELKASTQSNRPPPVDSNDTDISMNIVENPPEDAPVSLLDESTVIPSESSINVAKQRRERLRKSAVTQEEDFISLSVTRRDDLASGPHPESRLVREEDELGEGDDEYAEYTSAQERIALGKKSRKAEASKRRDEINEMIVDAEEEDEETAEWEQAQLRRTGQHAAEDSGPTKQVYRAAPIPPSTNLPSLGPAIDRLAQSLAALTTSHVTNTTSMNTLVEERDQLDTRESELRKLVESAEAKRSWFVAFREWIENVAAFLDDKYPKVESLEDEHVAVLKERFGMVSQRRKADDEDDLSLVFGSLPTTQATDSEELDELGRIKPQANPAALRRERRTARVNRRSARKATKSQGIDADEEGYSTDDSLPPSDALDYRSAMQRISNDAKSILSDVRASDFKDPRKGLAKWFGEWRGLYGDSYTGAWGGLGLVSAWEFWVRLEMLGWDPLEESQSLDDFGWYSALHEFSQDSNEGEGAPEGDLVSAMISTAVTPRLCKLIEGGAFDPYSNAAVRKVVDLTEQIEASIGSDHYKYLALLKSVVSVFEQAVTDAESLAGPYVALNRPVFDPDAIGARQRLLLRSIKLTGNMMRWRKYTGEKYGIGELCTRLSTRCFVRVAVSGWEVGGEEKARQLLSMLPRDLNSTVERHMPSRT